jgi:NAD(P)-dependent dehydrogenase (short-subunit alcohol dehydrogenase family)
MSKILFTRELARRLAGTRVTANACHPGLVASEFGLGGDTHGPLQVLSRPVVRWIGLQPAQGAVTQIWLASSPDVEGRTGGYYVRCRETAPSAAARDDEAARVLWAISEDLVGR